MRRVLQRIDARLQASQPACKVAARFLMDQDGEQVLHIDLIPARGKIEVWTRERLQHFAEARCWARKIEKRKQRKKEWSPVEPLAVRDLHWNPAATEHLIDEHRIILDGRYTNDDSRQIGTVRRDQLDLSRDLFDLVQGIGRFEIGNMRCSLAFEVLLEGCEEMAAQY